MFACFNTIPKWTNIDFYNKNILSVCYAVKLFHAVCQMYRDSAKIDFQPTFNQIVHIDGTILTLLFTPYLKWWLVQKPRLND